MSIEVSVLEQEGKEILCYPLKHKNSWFVGVSGKILYLHKDIVIRTSTSNEKNERTGYFETEDDAINAIKEYYSKPEL